MKNIFEEGKQVSFESKATKIKNKEVEKAKMEIEFEKLENKPPIMFEDWHAE